VFTFKIKNEQMLSQLFTVDGELLVTEEIFI
jgi:hypothetical protein